MTAQTPFTLGIRPQPRPVPAALLTAWQADAARVLADPAAYRPSLQRLAARVLTQTGEAA